MRVVSIINQKGGCGKTTTAVNLAASLATDGARVLLVDMDPQSHCAAGLGVPDQPLASTIAEALVMDIAMLPSVSEFRWEVGSGLSLVPSSVGLAALEAPHGPLASRHDRDRRLARVLAAWQSDFDWCIVDCPPTIGLLTYNALRAADLVIIPVETGYFSLKGAQKQIETIQAIVRRFGRDIPFRLLPTLYNASRKLSQDVVDELAKQFPSALIPLEIREHEALREAASYGQSISEFQPGSDAEFDFVRLARWLVSNAPQECALADFAGHDAPPIELNDELAHDDAVRTDADLLHAHNSHAAPLIETNRAADLAARLRALNERSRQTESAGGGHGVCVARNGSVRFTQPASAQALFVVGDFNDWNPRVTPLMATSDGLRMEATVHLPRGSHAYRIVVDGLETIDEFNLHQRVHADGKPVCLIEVPSDMVVSAPRTHADFAVKGGVR